MKRAIALVCAVLALAALFWFLRAAPAPVPAAVPVRAASVAQVPPGPATGASASAKVPAAPERATGAPAAAEPAKPAATPAAGDQPALFGKLVGMGQGLALSEALAKNAANADAYVDKLCDEARKLREHPALPQHDERNRDAANFMEPLIDYEKPLDDPPGRLRLPEARRERLASYGTEWPAKLTLADLAGLDFGWMTEALQYDHWTLLTAGRLRVLPVQGNTFNDPIPNYLSLMQWSKLRLGLGLRRGDVLAASKEVRHLADLIRTQHILIAEMIAVAVYGVDAHARRAAVAAGQDVSAWPVVDDDQRLRHRRATFGSMYFAYPGVSPATVRRAVACMPSPCPALLEGASANRAFGAFASVDNFALVGELARERGCESAVLERIALSKQVSAAEALEQVADDLDQQIPKYFPPAPAAPGSPAR